MSFEVYRPVMERLLVGADISREQAAGMMRAMMDGELLQPQSAALLTALAIKGVTADELTGFATTMRDKAVPLTGFEDALDTCGTGGSGLSTINTSTMCAFVVAAAGVRVAKHGNRSSSGNCGSADVLERLGVPLTASPKIAAALLEQVGVTFLFAPAYHPAMKHVVPVRKTIGFRTVFNFLGPLCNPARTRRQVVGVSDAKMARLMAEALAAMGSQRALLAHGDDGLDELSICGPSRLWHVEGGAVTEATIAPEDVGLGRHAADAIAGGDVAHNAAAFEGVLRGTDLGAKADHILLNAAAGLFVGGAASDLRDGVNKARQTIQSGEAWRRFEAYRSAAVQLAGAAS